MTEPNHHELKAWPEFYSALNSGRKTFDVRRNDRDYRVGDVVTFREFDPRSDVIEDPGFHRRIVYLLDLADVPGFGYRGFRRGDWVVLGLAADVIEAEIVDADEEV